MMFVKSGMIGKPNNNVVIHFPSPTKCVLEGFGMGKGRLTNHQAITGTLF